MPFEKSALARLVIEDPVDHHAELLRSLFGENLAPADASSTAGGRHVLDGHRERDITADLDFLRHAHQGDDFSFAVLTTTERDAMPVNKSATAFPSVALTE